MENTPIHPRLSCRILACFLLGASLTAAKTGTAHTGSTQPDWSLGDTIAVNESMDVVDDIDLAAPLTLDVSAGHTVHFSGNLGIRRSWLTGPGVTKTGDGQLRLTGENDRLEADTHLLGGTLHVEGSTPLGPYWQTLIMQHGTTLSLGADAVINNTVMINDWSHGRVAQEQNPAAARWQVAHGQARYLGRLDMPGNAVLSKTGNGILILASGSHVDSSSARLEIAEGGLQLDGEVAGRVSVLDGAWLGGQGWAGWLDIGPGARLQADGLLTVYKDVTFLPGSTLQVRAWADGRSDQLQSLGTAGLGGEVHVLPQGSRDDWLQGQDYVILQAQAGLNGSRFDSVHSALPYLTPSLSYTADAVHLRLEPRIIADEPDAPTAAQPSAWPASIVSQLLEDSRFVREAAIHHSRAQRGAWAYTFHSTGRRSAHAGATADRRVLNGLLLGVTRHLGPRWHASAYAGGSVSHLKGRKSHLPGQPDDARITSQHGGVALHGRFDQADLSVGAAWSRHAVRTSREAHSGLLHHPGRARHHATTAQAFARLALKGWSAADGQSGIQPFVQSAWVQTSRPAYTEHGGPLAMHMRAARQRLALTTLGLAGRYELALPTGPVQIRAQLGWRHGHGDRHSSAQQHYREDRLRTALQVSGQALARQAWELSLAVGTAGTTRTRWQLEYSGLYAKRARDHGVRLSLVHRW